jgi:hypothetical protein
VTDGLLSVDFDNAVAYDGGSSLLISGRLSHRHPTELRLYKTDLAFDHRTEVAITYRDGSREAGEAMQLGLVTSHGGATTTSWHHLGRTHDLGNGWKRAVVHPGRHRVGALALGFRGHRSGAFKINIGELSIRDAGRQVGPPVAPTGFVIDGTREDDGSLTVGFSWDFDPDIWYYDLRLVEARRGGHGSKTEWIGRISSDCYLAGDLPTSVIGSWVELVAVSKSGIESRPAQVRVPG